MDDLMLSRSSHDASIGYSKLRLLGASLGIFLVSGLADLSGLNNFIGDHVGRRIAFLFRDKIGANPPLNPKLKLIVLDDVAVSNQQLTELSLGAWAYLLKGLEAEEPSRIIIDKVFETPLRTADAAGFVRQIQALKYPVTVGSFARSEKISNRPTLPLDRAEFELTAYLPEGAQAPAWLLNEERYAYGPNPQFLAAFSHIGHIRIEDHLRYQAFLTPSKDRLIPHIAFSVAKSVKIDGDGIEADASKFLLDSQGRLTVNLLRKEQFSAATLRLDTVVDEIAKGQDIAELTPGDTILILPNAYTGGTDFKETPFGPMAGGLILASVINSALNKQWLTEAPPMLVTAVLLVTTAAGVLIGYALPLSLALATAALAFFSISVLGLVAFSSAGVIWPWLPGAFFSALSVAATALDRSRFQARYGQQVAKAFGASIAPSEIQELLRNPLKLDLKPSIRRVTVMFVDLVGFSKLAESIPADALFIQLRDVIGVIRTVVHDHHGFIDRTLGDGLLCYFGFRYDSPEEDPGHEHRALACAIALQRKNLELSLAAKKVGKVSYPMRIGINTDRICMGDLGDGKKVDFTAIGHGVNFAKRLETACDHFRVMLSQSTHEKLKLTELIPEALRQRYVQIKHHTELLPAYEYDPLTDSAPAKIEALRHYWTHIGVKRKENRHQVGRRLRVTLKGPGGSGRIVNFSIDGLSVLMGQYIACGATFAFEVDDGTGELLARCQAQGIMPLEAEVKWGEVESDGYLHGVVLKSMSPHAKQWFHDQLSRYVQLE